MRKEEHYTFTRNEVADILKEVVSIADPIHFEFVTTEETFTLVFRYNEQS